MGKFLFVFIAVVAINVLALGPVFAQEEIRILPANPFYFLKEWQRNIKVILSGPRKAEAILEVLDDKAMDFQKSQDNRVLESYKISAEQLLARAADILQNDLLSARLFNHALSNSDIFDSRILARVFQESQRPQDLVNQLTAAIETQVDEFRELRAVELLESINQEVLIKFRENLFIEFIGRLTAKALLVNEVQNLGGDKLRRLAVLDQVRELVSDPELKSRLNLARQQILEAGSPGISRMVSENAIKAASDQIGFGNPLLARAKFNLDQANQLHRMGNYAGAFGQASVSAAIVKIALMRLMYSPEVYKEEINNLKIWHENLLSRGGENPITVKILEEAKRGINRLSKSSRPNYQLLVDVKVALASAEILLQ